MRCDSNQEARRVSDRKQKERIRDRLASHIDAKPAAGEQQSSVLYPAFDE
jgi:hypothetical protein